MPSLPRRREPMLAVGVASSSSARIMRPARLRTMQLDSSIAVAQFIAVAATQPRCTCGYTPPVHRHSAAKRRPSSDGPRLTALAVFRPAGAGSPWRPPHRHVCKHGKCSSALSSSLCTRHHPLMHERPRDCLAAWPLRLPADSYSGPAPRLRHLKHPRDYRGHRASPRPPEPFPG